MSAASARALRSRVTPAAADLDYSPYLRMCIVTKKPNILIVMYAVPVRPAPARPQCTS